MRGRGPAQAAGCDTRSESVMSAPSPPPRGLTSNCRVRRLTISGFIWQSRSRVRSRTTINAHVSIFVRLEVIVPGAVHNYARLCRGAPASARSCRFGRPGGSVDDDLGPTVRARRRQFAAPVGVSHSSGRGGWIGRPCPADSGCRALTGLTVFHLPRRLERLIDHSGIA